MTLACSSGPQRIVTESSGGLTLEPMTDSCAARRRHPSMEVQQETKAALAAALSKRLPRSLADTEGVVLTHKNTFFHLQPSRGSWDSESEWEDCVNEDESDVVLSSDNSQSANCDRKKTDGNLSINRRRSSSSCYRSKSCPSRDVAPKFCCIEEALSRTQQSHTVPSTPNEARPIHYGIPYADDSMPSTCTSTPNRLMGWPMQYSDVIPIRGDCKDRMVTDHRPEPRPLAPYARDDDEEPQLINITDTKNQYAQRSGYYVNTAMANSMVSSTEESPSASFALNAHAAAYVPHVYSPIEMIPSYAGPYPPQPAHPPPQAQALPLATLLMDVLNTDGTADNVVGFESDNNAVNDCAPEDMPQAGSALLVDVDPRTTVMLRNVPYHEGQTGVLKLLEEKGFAGKFDFFYAPLDFNSGNNLGYAFISLRTPQAVAEFHDAMDGLRVNKEGWQQKELRVCWARVQGLMQNVEHYRNSPVNDMPEQFRPMIFDTDGSALPFPRPDTKSGNSPYLPTSASQTFYRKSSGSGNSYTSNKYPGPSKRPSGRVRGSGDPSPARA